MRRTVLAAIAAVCPALSVATPITLSWTGQITQYVTFTATTGDQNQSIADQRISGTVTYDPEVFAHLSGAEWGRWELSTTDNLDFVQTQTSWQNGLFVPDPAGATRNDVFRAIDEYTRFGGTPATDSLLFQDQQYDGTVVQAAYVGFLGVDMLGAGGVSNPSPFTIPGMLEGVYGYGSLFWRQGSYYDGYGYRVQFNIDSLSVVPASVPEPGGLALMIPGLLGMALWARRRRVQPARQAII